MNRRDFLNTLGMAAGATAASRPALGAPPERRPNFVWILSEDNSKHYLRLFDPAGAPAPAIEGLARQGVVFQRAFSNAPVCSVARTTLMTGVLAPRIGSQYHRKMQLANLPPGLRMFPAYLRDAGYYATNNSKKDYNVVEGKGVWDESSRKATWRKRPSKQTPFFHMMSNGGSHEGRLHFKPQQMKPENITTRRQDMVLADYHPDTPTFRHTYARYHDCIKAIDRVVGSVVQQLEEDGLLEDTFVFYFGDHGGVLPRSKGYIYESGLHVPLVVRIPQNWKHLVTVRPGTHTDGFVSFIDFGATVLRLAGIVGPDQVDGTPFLGPDVSLAELEARDEAFGYADRFDEKYDLCRSLRKGRFKYMRNYQAFYPDGLQNNYRYRMLAYQEWRTLFKQGKLNAAQRQFFEPKPAEALYDVDADPHEVRDLASDPAHAETLRELRKRLQTRVKSLPDLSFYPESHLIEHALNDGAAFGQAHRAEIGRLIDVADLSLLPFAEAEPELRKALTAENCWERYWALIACSCFADSAKPLTSLAAQRLTDPVLLVRVRAAEFLAITGARDPNPTFRDVLSTTQSATEALITLNSVVFVNDHLDCAPFELEKLQMTVPVRGEVKRRIDYLKTTRT